MAVKTEDKRRRILSAALDCFEKQGFDAARMDDIARCAGVAKGTIYNYFKSKEELLRALSEGFAGVMRRNLENVARDQDKDLSFKETFLRIAAPLIDGTARSKRNLRIFRLIWAEGLRAPELTCGIYASLFLPVFKRDGLLAALLDRADVPDFVRERPVVLFAPIIQSIFINMIIGGDLIGDPREYVSRYLDLILTKSDDGMHRRATIPDSASAAL